MLLNSDARLIPLADGCVQCVVTSPPYWGLRKYSGDMVQVFGGVAGCKHEWGDEQIRKQTIGATLGGPKTTLNSGQFAINYAEKVQTSNISQGAFCRLCGAWRGELGLEPTPEMFVEHIVEIFREVRRVLRDDGLVFLNLGDSYAGSGGPGNQYDNKASPKYKDNFPYYDNPNRKVPGLKPKDLCGIPWRVAFALQADGWYLRSDVIWSKPNPMPESLAGWRWEQHRVKVGREPVDWGAMPKGWDSGEGSHDDMPKGNYRTDGERDPTIAKWIDCPGCDTCEPNGGLVLRRGSWRPTKSHEYLFMLAKSDRYFCDADAIREPIAEATISRNLYPHHGAKNAEGAYSISRDRQPGEFGDEVKGRNKRTVWEIPTAPFKGSHFATYPPALVEPCIKAGTSERGCCPACGASWARVIEVNRPDTYNPAEIDKKVQEGWGGEDFSHNRPLSSIFRDALQTTRDTLGFRPTCDCWRDMPAPTLPRTKDKRKRYQQDAGDYWKIRAVCYGGKTKPALVLDPFCGSGTTLLVARKLGRRGVGTDLSFPYLRDQARKRLSLDRLDMWRDGGKEVETRLQGLPMWAECAE